MDPLQISEKDAAEMINRLTPRQKEVLIMLARGFSCEEAASLLSIAMCTVRVHMRNSCTRLNAVNPLQAAVLMARSIPDTIPVDDSTKAVETPNRPNTVETSSKRRKGPS